MSWAVGLPSGQAQGAWPEGRTPAEQGYQRASPVEAQWGTAWWEQGLKGLLRAERGLKV